MGDRVTIDLLEGRGIRNIVQPGTGITVLDGLVGIQLPFSDRAESKSVFIPTRLIAKVTIESSARFDVPGISPAAPHTHTH